MHIHSIHNVVLATADDLCEQRDPHVLKCDEQEEQHYGPSFSVCVCARVCVCVCARAYVCVPVSVCISLSTVVITCGRECADNKVLKADKETPVHQAPLEPQAMTATTELV